MDGIIINIKINEIYSIMSSFLKLCNKRDTVLRNHGYIKQRAMFKLFSDFRLVLLLYVRISGSYDLTLTMKYDIMSSLLYQQNDKGNRKDAK